MADSGAIAFLHDHPVIRFADDRATASVLHALLPLPLHLFEAFGPPNIASLYLSTLLTLCAFLNLAALLLAAC
jgi:hypothetical protein